MDKAVEDANHKGEIINLNTKLTKADIRTEVVEIVKTKKDLISLTDESNLPPPSATPTKPCCWPNKAAS